jgi:tetratricopeptide (TPR) repeat protein
MYAAVRCAAICIFSLAVLAMPSLAQKPPSAGSSGPSSPNSGPDIAATSSIPVFGSDAWSASSEPSALMPEAIDASRVAEAEACNTWTESGTKSPTVSVARLAVPGKATSEYQKGCGAFKGKRLDEAEQHVRNAIQLYPNYAAAWVVLGQILDAQKKRDDARQACSQARSVDPTYVAPYLCLADFAASEGNWEEVSILSGGALALDPAGNAYSFYYAAAGALHHGNLSQSEKDAQNAVKLDTWHHIPQVHLVLAEIYQAQGNSHGQAIQLHEYLKFAPNSRDASTVKTTLAQLEAQTSK